MADPDYNCPVCKAHVEPKPGGVTVGRGEFNKGKRSTARCEGCKTWLEMRAEGWRVMEHPPQ